MKLAKEEKFTNQIKSSNGITLISLIITIIIILILSFTISANLNTTNKLKLFNDFKNDIDVLEERISLYVSKNGELPITGGKYTDIGHIENRSRTDNDNYYVIDLNILENITLTNGRGYFTYKEAIDRNENVSNIRDIYIINEQSHTIYYPKGLNIEEGRTIYSLYETETDIDLKPACIITADLSKIEKENKITYTLDFSDKVTGFTTDGITLINGAKGIFTEIEVGKKYTIEATTQENKNIQTIIINKDVCTLASNSNIRNVQSSKTVLTSKFAISMEEASNVGVKISYVKVRVQDYIYGLKQIILPNGEIVNCEGEKTRTFVYGATENGPITIKVQNINGQEIEKTIVIKNIGERFSEIYEENKIYTDYNGNTATIPKGFAVGISEGIDTVESGLVITDKVDVNRNSIGNEFVFVPVVSAEEWKENFSYPSNYSASASNTTNGILPTGISVTNIVKIGGFYIARYEAGDSTVAVARTSSSSQSITPVSKKERIVYNYITQENAKTVSSAMYNNSSVVSGLITGAGWDVTMNFISNHGEKKNISDSSKWGNHNDNVNKTENVVTTGYNNTWKANNIYDLAGNAWEQINEKNTSGGPFVVRGGNYNLNGSVYSVSGRYNSFGSGSNNDTFRVALYIKPQAVIPEGFYHVAGTTVENGFVISDVKDDDLENTKGGNQFVWIPVESESDWKQNFSYPSNYSASVSNTIDGILPAGISAANIAKIGGFYIARYEAGDNTTQSARTTTSSQIITPVSKKGSIVYNYITQENAKTVSTAMYNNSSVISGLITGSGWDVTMNYIATRGEKKSITDSSNWGNHLNSIAPANVNGYGSLQITGYSEYWKANNIYDIAGNAWEYVNEKNNNTQYSYIGRGGGYYRTGSDYPASFRGYNDGTSYAVDSFRVALYLK